jgi:hypothetical protein
MTDELTDYSRRAVEARASAADLLVLASRAAERGNCVLAQLRIDEAQEALNESRMHDAHANRLAALEAEKFEKEE